jgi:transcriptional regulator of arginine metabolism
MKGRRQDKILEIIEKYEVTTQEELADRLNEAGFRVTQATVSRDIRELHLFKVAGSSGRQKYAALPGKEEEVWQAGIWIPFGPVLSPWPRRRISW